MNYKDHEIATLFPLMSEPELKELSDDIREHGLQEDILIYEGKILDGRNRYRACAMAGVQVTSRVYAGDDPVGYVLSLNLHRRHLSAPQKAAVAAEALPHFEEEAKKRQIRKPESVVEKIPPQNHLNKSRDQAAAQVGVNPRYVSDAKRIKEASPETFEKLKSGEISMSEAKERAIPKPQPLPQLKLDVADRIWAVAKSHLDKITPDDVSWDRVMNEALTYISDRLKSHK